MKNTFGNSLSLTLFGESHGEAVGAVLDGLAPGIPVNPDDIRQKLRQRRPEGTYSTARREDDEVRILSGVFRGYTTGTPLALLIPNRDTNSADYTDFRDTPRPSHADYTALLKYHGFQDDRGGGHFSGRLTAPLVAAGAILQSALEGKGILIGSHISRLHGLADRDFLDTEADLRALSAMSFPVLDPHAAELMKQLAGQTALDGDSLGGILETAVTGFPSGVGEPWFDTVEGLLSHALFSIPAVKGVEFGLGFGFSDCLGSQANDAFTTDGQTVSTVTNHNGGINGGISNGMPILFRTVIKPTPSIRKMQETVHLPTLTNTSLTVSGRHDPMIVHRARAAVDAVTALVLSDLLVSRFGTDVLAGGSGS